MKTLLFSAAVLCAAAAAAPAFAFTATAPQAPRHEMKAMTRAEMLKRVQEHFAKLDANKDGFVSKEEMESAQATMQEHMADRMKQRESSMFDRMDSNHDGSISRAEFDAAHGKVGQMAMPAAHAMHGAMAGHMFSAADSNNDGRVSLQEATAAAAAHFDKLDSNHDGTITPDEMRAAHKGMRGSAGRR